jgi:hypothetical protein
MGPRRRRGSEAGSPIGYKDGFHFAGYAKELQSKSQLWRRDGTKAGTSLVKVVFAGTTEAHLLRTYVGGVTLYCVVNDDPDGCSSPTRGSARAQLWKTDGTPGGTVLVKRVEDRAIAEFERRMERARGGTASLPVKP